MIKTCPHCKNEFETTNSRKVYCSDKCKLRNHKELNAKEQTCKQCSKTFYSYKAKEFCGVECRKQHTFERNKNVPNKYYTPREKHTQVCVNCNKTYETHQNSKYCSYECSYAYKVKQKPIHNTKCKECAKFFSGTDKSKAFCSVECGNKFHNRKKETVRRKRIMKNGKVNWDISIERLMKRDGGNCYLCNKTVDIKADTNDDRYPSIEHVIPICKGGTHTWDNVKLAHRGCNVAKGTEIIGELAENLN